MSRGVRGPNSALTEFLRNEGITDAFQRRVRSANTSETTPEANSEEIVVISGEPDDDEEEIRAAGRAKRRAIGDDLDSEYEEDDLKGFKKFGEEDVCIDCNDTFNLTVYSRYLTPKKGYLCEKCNTILKKKEQAIKRTQLNARKKRKKVALALLDKSSIRIPKLQDICIKRITASITDVEGLGDIGEINMNKISRILCKNRSLTSDTVELFLRPDLKTLSLWDCLNVGLDSYDKIAAFCPNVESLTLFMCGQFHNLNLKYFSTNLLHLRELSLNGAFLISNDMWQEFFESDCAKNLKTFEIRNTHRFDNDTLISLLENVGGNLTSLKLSLLDALNSPTVWELLPHYLLPSTMTHLEISHPHSPELITDDLLINILATTGETLLSLNLDGCTHLSDRFLLEGVAQFCPNLTHLSLKQLENLTNEGFAQAMDKFSLVNTGGLISVDLTKCCDLADEAIYALLNHSLNTLVQLSLNSLRTVSKDFLLQLLSKENSKEDKYSYVDLPLLTTLDVGFLTNLDDEVLDLLQHAAPKLSVVEVFGNNRCTFRVRVRKDLLVIGRQEF